MPVVSFATTKGGAGKTTAAIALATQLAKRDVTVTLMDCDPEQWSASWGRAAGQNQVLPKTLKVVSAPREDDDLLAAIAEAERHSTFVILDLEGSANAAVGYSIARSDLVIIPMQASGMDGRAALKTIRHVSTQQTLLKRKIPMAILFTRTSAAIKSKLQRGLTANLAKANIPTFKVELMERSAFKEMLTRHCPLESLGTDVSGVDKAITNAASFAGEVVQVLKGQGQTSSQEASSESAELQARAA